MSSPLGKTVPKTSPNPRVLRVFARHPETSFPWGKPTPSGGVKARIAVTQQIRMPQDVF